MSVKIMGLVWDLDLDPVDKLVLLAYADHADHQGRNIRPSVHVIAKKTRLTIRSVQKVTQRLRTTGYLIPVRYVQGGRGHPIEYRLALPPEPLTGERAVKGAPDDTLSPRDDLMSTGEAASESYAGKGAPDDTLLGKGEPGDAKG